MSENMQGVCWMDGAVLPTTRARVPVLDHGLLYGDGVFEGLRFYGGRVFRADLHLRRLYRSAAAICLRIPCTATELEDRIAQTVHAFGGSDGYLRLIITRGTGSLGLDPASCATPRLLILADRIDLVDPQRRAAGLRLIITATRRLPPDGLDPRVKSLNYLNHILARLEARNAGADEAILLNGAGRVAECSADNIFVVHEATLLTPPVTEGALDGVTRGAVLELAAELGITARETPLTPYDLYTAEECFLTGTAMELAPVREIDGRPLQRCPGPVYSRLAAAFQALVQTEAHGC
jgi:branched-chain amino acid aminotransferase